MEFHRVTCFGTGLIGGSWSTLFALKGVEVTLYDMDEKVMEDAAERVRSHLNVLVREGLIGEGDEVRIAQNIRTSTDLEDAVGDAEYVQESVFEDYELKKKVYKRLDELTPPKVVLASSSSGLLISEIQGVTENPGRCIIAHPWNPPHLIPLVEVVPGKSTSKETIEKTRRFMSDLGKVPVVLNKEVPGFIGNRLSAALWREAINLLREGVASAEDIDKAVYAGPGLRWAVMGPFMTYHLGGGEGGIRKFIEGIGRTFSNYWETMDEWTSIPDEAVELMAGEMEKSVKEETFDEIASRRDEKMLTLIKALYPNAFSRSERC